jgi:hypothetical protein
MNDVTYFISTYRKGEAMMPVVRINDTTFADISTLKTWFKTKSPSDTIDRIVREAMEQLGIEHDDETEGDAVASTDGTLLFDAAPSLTFTKPMKVTINGKTIQNPNWAAILVVSQSLRSVHLDFVLNLQPDK